MLYENSWFHVLTYVLMKGLIIISASLAEHGPGAADSGLPEIRRFLRINEFSVSRHISSTRVATIAGPQLGPCNTLRTRICHALSIWHLSNMCC
ncbi:hypothetical protein ACQKWADRAFT_304842 [Trichoderma austrokoningii]